MLKLQFRDRRRESVWLVDQNFTIGKAADNSLVINEKDILDHHIQITNTHEKLTLENISSSSNVLLNDKPVANKATLQAGDHIIIGGIDLELIDPKHAGKKVSNEASPDISNAWSIFSNASWLEKNRFIIGKRTIIGRDPSCDITLPLEHLSRKHLALEVRGSQLYIEDLGSSNGTYLNGRKVQQSVINKGDKIKIDVLTFEVSGPAHDPNKTIIRTAGSGSSADKRSNSRLTTKVQNPAKKQGAAASKPKPRTAKKQLVSEGKQEWISGDSTPSQQEQNKQKTGLILAGVLVVSSIIAGAIIMLL